MRTAAELLRTTVVEPRQAPRAAEVLLRPLRFFDRLFESLYTSRYNLLQESGPLAVGLMLVVVVTGLWLLLFFRVGAPFESVAGMLQRPALAGWVRGLHRYASDATVVVVAVHVLRMLAEGRTHGPRLLAWVSGVVLLFFVLVCGWTGFVLAWDDQGRAVALGGARLIEAFVGGVVSAPFVTPKAISASFFFMNLFLHVALPLGMLLGLWLHTLRLSRVRWLPRRRLLVAVGAALALLSILFPPALGPAADGQSLAPPAAVDLFFNGWLLAGGAWVGLAALVGLLALVAAAPWYWRPRPEERRPVSTNDKSRCEGCTQCLQDCPFGAISMVAGPRGLVADVDPSLCTSCGLCAGSCEQLVIGPPDRTPRLQLAALKQVRQAGPAESVVVVHCQNACLDVAAMAGGVRVVPHGIPCTGSLHPAAVENLLHHFAGVFVASCPPAACQMREGPALTAARLQSSQRPSRLGGAPSRVAVVSLGAGEKQALARALARFAAELGLGPKRPASGSGLSQVFGETGSRLVRFAAALVLLGAMLTGLAAASAVRPATAAMDSALRLVWRMPGQVLERCRDLTPDELLARPVHMRLPRECEVIVVSHTLRVAIDGAAQPEQVLSPRGRRGDGPEVVNLELPVSPGEHAVRVELERGDGDEALVFGGRLQFEPGRAQVLGYDAVAKRLGPEPLDFR